VLHANPTAEAIRDRSSDRLSGSAAIKCSPPRTPGASQEDFMRRLVFAGLLASSLAGAPFAVSQPATLADLDFSKLKGSPVGLSWSSTNGEFYLQTADDDGKIRHYIVGSADAKAIDAQPDWAAAYWKWKSARAAPGPSGLVIEVNSQQKSGQVPSQSLREKAAGMSNGATAMRGAADAANSAETVRTLILRGEVIGEYVEAPLIPGMTFGWSPEPLHSVAFVPHSGHLMLMDILSGEKQEIAGTSGVLLPAWSPDGSRIAFLQKTARRKYALMQVTVERP
jgi:hypothetical protein